jgi:hypothetical protein
MFTEQERLEYLMRTSHEVLATKVYERIAATWTEEVRQATDVAYAQGQADAVATPRGGTAVPSDIDGSEAEAPYGTLDEEVASTWTPAERAELGHHRRAAAEAYGLKVPVETFPSLFEGAPPVRTYADGRQEYGPYA